MVKRLFACVLSITTTGVPPKQILKRPKQFHLCFILALWLEMPVLYRGITARKVRK